MEFEVFDIIVFVTGTIVGFAGALIFRTLTKKNPSGRSQSAGATIEALQHELERRQVLIDDHFLQLHSHINAAEKKLSDAKKAVLEGASTMATITLEKWDHSNSSEDESDTPTTQPRDYASKSSDDESTLKEGYGLTRKKNEEPKRVI